MARDGLFRALIRGEISEGRYALERARSLFRPREVRAWYGDVAAPDPRAATILLRDLALRVGQLPPSERAEALRLLARPDDGPSDPDGNGYTVPSVFSCSTNLCFHWVQTTEDAPPPDDADGNAIPDWVETTAAVFEEVWAREVEEYRYRPPKSDLTSANNGSDGRLDVYLVDLGDDGLFGYCTTDDPNAVIAGTAAYPYFDVSAYCVVDDDFSPSQFAGLDSLDALRVTAAHEFFHAVQFAYDFAEDLWLMEGTASWIEDEVYDDVNDNHRFLAWSALRRPEVPLDFGREFFPYGSWLFWRFLTEYTADSPDPTVVREVWELADAGPEGPDRYSLKAARRVLRERGTPFRFAFADFGAVNSVPWVFYSEGEDYGGGPAATKRITLSTGRPRIEPVSVTLDHLSNAYVLFRAGAGVEDRARILVTLDLPRYRRGPEATLVVLLRSGKVQLIPLALTGKGDGSQGARFGPGRVLRVVLVLTNASTRIRSCFLRATPYSCSGAPRDDNLAFEFQAELVQ